MTNTSDKEKHATRDEEFVKIAYTVIDEVFYSMEKISEIRSSKTREQPSKKDAKTKTPVNTLRKHYPNPTH